MNNTNREVLETSLNGNENMLHDTSRLELILIVVLFGYPAFSMTKKPVLDTGCFFDLLSILLLIAVFQQLLSVSQRILPLQ